MSGDHTYYYPADDECDAVSTFRAKPQSPSDRIANDLMATYQDELERRYRQERRVAAETLYNAFAEAIAEQHPTVETTLYVIRMMEAEVLAQRRDAEFGPASPVERKPGKPVALGVA